ncbi:MAG: helix-turn-helix domain-containing protein [Acidimicrobiales bacterium]
MRQHRPDEPPTKREPGQHQRRLNDHEVAAVIADYRHGRSVRQIAAKYGIHQTTTYEHLKRHGVPLRGTQAARDDSDLLDALSRRQQGHSYASIAALFGVHPDTVRRALKRP